MPDKRKMHGQQTKLLFQQNGSFFFGHFFFLVFPFAWFVSPDPNNIIIRFEQLLIFSVYNPFANGRQTERNENFHFFWKAQEWWISATDADPFEMKTNNELLMWNEVFDVISQELLNNTKAIAKISVFS